jgi:hypothetical protein
MLDFLSKLLTVVGPIALALMGFYVTGTQARSLVWWRGTFAAVALITVAAQWVNSSEQGRRLDIELTGGKDNYPAMFGLMANPALFGLTANSGEMPLLIENALGQSPLLDVTYSIKYAGLNGIGKPGITVRNWGTLLGGAWPTGVSLGPGFYQIDMYARNGWFVEMFKVEMCKGRLSQAYSITKPAEGGRVLLDSRRESGCFQDFPPYNPASDQSVEAPWPAGP